MALCATEKFMQLIDAMRNTLYRCIACGCLTIRPNIIELNWCEIDMYYECERRINWTTSNFCQSICNVLVMNLKHGNNILRLISQNVIELIIQIKLKFCFKPNSDVLYQMRSERHTYIWYRHNKRYNKNCLSVFWHHDLYGSVSCTNYDCLHLIRGIRWQ